MRMHTPKPIKVRVASDDFQATCHLCHTAFKRAEGRMAGRAGRSRHELDGDRGVLPQRLGGNLRAEPAMVARARGPYQVKA
jgi:hypothetical protein